MRPSSARRRRHVEAAPNQPGLFDDLWKPLALRAPPPPATPSPEPVARIVHVSKSAPAPQPASAGLIGEADVPAYPAEQVSAVEEAIAAIRTDRVLLGYKDLAAFFGVSKATANRRMKEGLVPGVRIVDGVVLRDGGVRRLSREQVKWLLLAVRYSRPEAQ